MHGGRIARNQRGRHRLMKRLKYPKVGGGKKAKEQENREKKGEMERHKEQRDTEAHRAGKRKENGPREAERTCRREKPKMKSRNSRKEARIRKR